MMKKVTIVKNKSGYWYLTEIEECVLCGAGGTTRRRIYDKPKPKDARDRYRYTQFACRRHFC